MTVVGSGGGLESRGVGFGVPQGLGRECVLRFVGGILEYRARREKHGRTVLF